MGRSLGKNRWIPKENHLQIVGGGGGGSMGQGENGRVIGTGDCEGESYVAVNKDQEN